jgi:hypothetical protein
MKENFGGSVYTYKPSNPIYKVWSVWRVTDRQARDVLATLMPYLIVKKKQAQLVIDFIDVCQRQREEMKITQKRPYRVTPAMFDVRMDYWQQVSDLNASASTETSMTAMATPHYSPLSAANRLQCICSLFTIGILSGITHANQFIFDSGILSV